MNIFNKMAKIIVLSLMIATTTLIALYFIIHKQLLSDQLDKAKLATDSIIVMKYSEMSFKNSFSNIINLYNKKTNMKFEFYTYFKNKALPFDKNFINELKKKKTFYKMNWNVLTYYRPVTIQNECLRCHGGEKTNQYTGFKKGDFIGVIEAKIPVKNQVLRYNKTFLFIFFILGIALIVTLYYFYDYMKTIREDINKILLYFKNKIKKGIYKPLKTKMNYAEFEKLKEEINKAVSSIVYYRDQMIKNYLIHPLSKLPNRMKLTEDLKKGNFYIAILNVNGFRQINNFFGQKIGEELIIEIGKRLKKLTKTYHINIDEFAIPLPYKEKEKNMTFLSSILENLEKPYEIGDKEIILTFRCGMNDDENLFGADIAIEYAKRKKEKCLCFCDIKNSIKEIEKNLKMLNIFVKAIKNDKIIVYYQPIIENKTKEVVKYEALVRIEDEEGKIYPPADFLDIAKKANLYPEITKKVFTKALEKFKNKKEIISLNLGLEDFENEKIIEFIKQKIEKFPEPEKITIELLESENITESGKALNFLHWLKFKGVKIFVDDFGSGYSNFNYLFNFEVDGFKIDGSLIKNILTDEKSQMIVETMVMFAKKGGMRTVAEFVENEEIYKKLLSLGIDCSQGYYFGKPQEII